MLYAGIDVHKRCTQICIEEEDGVLYERRILTERQRLLEEFGRRPKMRILLEAATESEWVARCLEELGHEVIVGDPNFAPMYAQRSRRVKTDKRDARALLDANKLGAYKVAHRCSDANKRVRARIAIRDTMVQTRTKFIGLVRALLRQEGIKPERKSSLTFARRVRDLAVVPASLAAEIAPTVASPSPSSLASSAISRRGQRSRNFVDNQGRYKEGQDKSNVNRRRDCSAVARGKCATTRARAVSTQD